MAKARVPSDLLSHALADGLVVLVVVIWWQASRHLPPIVLPSPWAVAVSMSDFATDADLWRNVVATGLRVLVSVLGATVIGGGLAMLAHHLPILRDLVLNRLQPLLGAMPSVGWAILGVIWFNVSDTAVIFIQTAILVPFCLTNISQGLRELDPELIEMGRSFTRAPWRIFRSLTLPLLSPYLIAAIRLAYGVCWKIALVSELFGADTGLGYVMYQAQLVSDASMVLATSLVIVVLFLAGDACVLGPLARRLAPTAS